MNAINDIVKELICDELEDLYGLIMSNVKASCLDETSFEDNKCKIDEASIQIINNLNHSDNTIIIIDGLKLKNNSVVSLRFKLTKNEFDDSIIDFRKSSLDIMKKMLEKNSIMVKNIDYIIGNKESLSITSIENSLQLTFGKRIYVSSKKIID